MSTDPSSIYVQFINEFKKFKYWVWDSFDFSGMTVDQAIEIEAPNHVIYEPQDDDFDYLPVVTFAPEEEFDNHKVYSVYIYDEIENSYFVTKFASDTGLIRISSESYGNCYRHYYQKNVFYRKVMDHSIDFFNLSENPPVCKNSFKDFHLIPVLRPWNNQGPLNLLAASIPNTDRRIDISSHLQEDKKRDIPTGEWEFYIDHEKWESWAACYRALVHYFHGFKMAVRLKDHELDRIYQGRITVKNYAPGNDYSKIILEYQLLQDQVSDPSKLGLCFQVWWLDWDRNPISYETIYWSAKPSNSSTSSGTSYTPSPRSAFDNQSFTPDLPVKIEIISLPSIVSYYVGEVINYSGIGVRAYNSAGAIWSANSRYLSGMVPYSELQFTVSKASFENAELLESYCYQIIPVNWPRVDDRFLLSSTFITKLNQIVDHIEVKVPPNIVDYIDGDTIDYTGITVIAYTRSDPRNPSSKLIPWTNNGAFENGVIPLEDLIFTVETAEYGEQEAPTLDSKEAEIPVKYIQHANVDIEFSANFTINVSPEPLIPVRIEIYEPPTVIDYFDGQQIDYAGMIVKAYTEDGEEVESIPFEELIFPVTVADLDEAEVYRWSDGSGVNAMLIAYTQKWFVDWRGQDVQVYTSQILGEYGGKPFMWGGNTGHSQPTTFFATNYNGTVYIWASTASQPMNGWVYNEGAAQYQYQMVYGSSATTGTGEVIGAGHYDEHVKNIPESAKMPNGTEEMHAEAGKQKIPVQWVRQEDGKVLETYYEITVEGFTPE